ncbi:patatin-like phospholipase [Maritalea mobilis]|uniref:Patatin-like phospholipase n=1 Tax=Maritalea mobilis TaxID=483324 RepID=A0A4R6VQH0_9HYPH|nr:patatin-like phospholipase family protein [Maritalea mobilis]TDQ66259.1 patatin-like phospholipase [Maritalea mobilis]
MSAHTSFRALLSVMALLLTLFLAACATDRTDYTMSASSAATVPNLKGVRIWADDPRIVNAKLWSPSSFQNQSSPLTMLSLSGGGAEGAFGAGFLTGWSKAGTRPQFTVVSGTSTGALLAPFAFLGRGYDPILARLFTEEKTSDLVRVAGLSAIFGSSVLSAQPLEKMVARYVTPTLLQQIAAEHKKGRRLYVITTNIDTQRTAIWDMGAIASAQNESALNLFRQVLVASASVPGVLPPQYIEVTHQGQTFKEMHVDGGVTANIMLLPEAIVQAGQLRNFSSTPTLYLLVNGKIGHEYKLVKPHTVSILERSFGSSIKANSRQSIIAAQQFAKRHGWKMRMAALRMDYDLPVNEVRLDETELTQLFNEGVRAGASNDRWQNGL